MDDAIPAMPVGSNPGRRCPYSASVRPRTPALVQALHQLDLANVVEIMADDAEEEIHEPVVPAVCCRIVQSLQIKYTHRLHQLPVL